MEQVRGVNLGGWLVLERWLTPTLFKSRDARDEFELCEELGDQKAAILKHHYDTWITETDFAWLASRGVNTVRLPVGYWLFGDAPPYAANVDYVDAAFTWASKHSLQIILDMHGAPGSQNGNDHSGRKGRVAWPKPENVYQTLDIIEWLSERYGQRPQLLAIELLNEPSSQISKKLLTQFYEDGYRRVRNHSSAAVIISDAWQPKAWQKALPAAEFPDTWLDVHVYQVFGRDDQKRSMLQHLQKARQQGDELRAITSHPVLIGEWSLALPQKAFRGLGDFDRDKALQAYARAQLAAFANTRGWCYWTFKTEDGGAWNFRDCYQRGWFPSNLVQ